MLPVTRYTVSSPTCDVYAAPAFQPIASITEASRVARSSVQKCQLPSPRDGLDVVATGFMRWIEDRRIAFPPLPAAIFAMQVVGCSSTAAAGGGNTQLEQLVVAQHGRGRGVRLGAGQLIVVWGRLAAHGCKRQHQVGA